MRGILKQLHKNKGTPIMSAAKNVQHGLVPGDTRFIWIFVRVLQFFVPSDIHIPDSVRMSFWLFFQNTKNS